MQAKLVKLAVFVWPIDAYLLKTRLEVDGIGCYIFDDNLIGLNWLYANAVGGVKLYISSEDLEKALEIMDQGLVEDDRCFNCDSSNLKFKRISGWLLLGSYFILGVPVPFKGTWKCKDCGEEWV